MTDLGLLIAIVAFSVCAGVLWAILEPHKEPWKLDFMDDDVTSNVVWFRKRPLE